MNLIFWRLLKKSGCSLKVLRQALNHLGQSDVKEAYFDRYILIYNY